MLSLVGATGPTGLSPGTYTCSAQGGGSFKIEIRDASTYVDRAGKSGSFRLDTASSLITFESGSLAGQYSKLLGAGKFGLSASQTTMFYTVCNLRQ